MFNKFSKSKCGHRSQYWEPKATRILLAALLLVMAVFSFGNETLIPAVHAQSSSDYGACYTKPNNSLDYVYYQQTTRDNCVWQAYYNSTAIWRYGYWTAGNYGYATYFSINSSSGYVYRWSGSQWIYWYNLF
jgi:hypothetical protein